MAGYAAARRIERIDIRGGVVARRLACGPPPIDPSPTVVVIELAGTEPGAHLRQRLDDLRVYLGQLTWYLFNAEGWR